MLAGERHEIECVACGSLLLDTHLQQLRRGDAAVHVQPKAMAVAEKLMRHAGRRVSHEALIGAMYASPDDEPEGALVVLRVMVNRLRRALRQLGASETLLTVYDSGYVLGAPPRVVRVYDPEEARVADAAVASMPRRPEPPRQSGPGVPVASKRSVPGDGAVHRPREGKRRP